MKIITISREFGSGGRELGKRLAEELGIHCYDHEIIELIAKEHGFDERYVANISEKCIEAAYPMTIGHRFAMPPVQIMDQGFQVAAAQQQIIENFAKQGDCVIVGRCADVILKDYHPLNLFVYADAESKIQCDKRTGEVQRKRRLLLFPCGNEAHRQGNRDKRRTCSGSDSQGSYPEGGPCQCLCGNGMDHLREQIHAS